MADPRRTIVAIICGSFVPAVPLVIALAADAPVTLSTASEIFAATWSVCALVASTLGLIWHTVALERGWTNAFLYMIAGAILGGLIPGVFLVGTSIYALLNEHSFDPTLIVGITVGSAILGTLTALAFWIIRRPDRDVPNPRTSTP